MSEQKPEQEKKVSPKGAVEVDEEKLDEAAGGISSYSKPTDSFSLNYSKIEVDYAQKVAPSDPSISDATSLEKKI